MTRTGLNHLAIIMDGNRRWAKARSLPTLEGHRRGYEKMKRLAEWCIDAGISVLTVYAFSTENWNRTAKEVSYLMKLLRDGLRSDIDELHRQGVRLKVIGDSREDDPAHPTPVDIVDVIANAEEKTRHNTKLLFQVGLSYGGREELQYAFQNIARKGIPADEITTEHISRELWTAPAPYPDMIVRTSGEMRLSNFLLWQSAYAELCFIKKHWPDFSKRDLEYIVREYQSRKRRFGK